MIYLVEVSVPNRLGYDTKLTIEEGTIEEIKESFIETAKLRFFKLEELK